MALCVLGVLIALPSRTHAQTVASGDPALVAQASEEVQRQAILTTLDRTEIRRVAGAAGLDLGAARERVTLLEGEALGRTAVQAREVERAIDGTISSTTLIILLVLTILIIVLVQD